MGFHLTQRKGQSPFNDLQYVFSVPLFLDFHIAGSPTSFKPLLKYHLFNEAFPDDPTSSWVHLLTPALTTHLYQFIHYYHPIYNMVICLWPIFHNWTTSFMYPHLVAHSRHSVSSCWVTKYLLPSHLLFLLLMLSPYTHILHIF